MKRNPRPRKYESAAARQAAYKARAEVLEFRAEPKTAASLTNIAQELDVSRSELLLSMVKFALTNHDWARFGLTHKTLPYYQGNPIMATKKASPAQLAARKKFAEMARSGAFKKAKRAADRDKNPAKKGLYSNIDAKRKRIAAGSGEKMRKPGSPGAPTNASFRAAAKTAKRNPAKKTVSQKISQLMHEGYPQKQAVAVALSEKRAGKVKSNPMEHIAGEHFYNLGNNYFGKVTMTGNNEYYAVIFYDLKDKQIVPDYKPRYFATAKAAINSVMKYATKNKLKSNPIVPNENFDYALIQEIKLVAENDENLYRRQGRPIVENLAKKMAKGTFDAAKAVKLYEYLADSAVKDYSVSQFGKRTPTLTILSKPERQVLAQQLFESYADEIEYAAKEIMAKSGKKTTRTNPSKRSRSAVVLNPAKKRSYTVYCQVDGQSINSWTKLATFYSATKATQYAKAYAKQYPKHYVRVESHG